LKPVEEFLQEFGFDLIYRVHQAIMEKVEFPFPNNQSVVTVFSAPNYCYEYENRGAILHVDENLYCSFTQLEPMKYDANTIQGVESRPGTPPILNLWNLL
jgi:serine/threonine-protein phosphatase PP1 catalytic subunit